MAEPLSTGTLELLMNLGDKMADMLALEARAGAGSTLAQQVIEQYARARLIYSEISAALELFNQRVAESFGQAGPEPLRELLTPGGYTRMETNFREWQAAGVRRLVLEHYELLAARQPEAAGGEITGRQAQAFTLESWTFEHEDGANQKEQSFNQYTLERAHSGWQIQQVDFFTRD